MRPSLACCRPQLAGQCGGFDVPSKKFPNGFLVEVKFDGERVQAHMRNGKVVFFSRSLKAIFTPPTFSP